MNRYHLTGLALACVLPLAMAEENSPSYGQCMDKASSTVAMSSCIQAETQLQDQRLNRVYKQLMGKLEAGSRNACAKYSASGSPTVMKTARSTYRPVAGPWRSWKAACA